MKKTIKMLTILILAGLLIGTGISINAIKQKTTPIESERFFKGEWMFNNDRGDVEGTWTNASYDLYFLNQFYDMNLQGNINNMATIGTAFVDYHYETGKEIPYEGTVYVYENEAILIFDLGPFDDVVIYGDLLPME